MMSAAKFELCKELFEITNWEGEKGCSTAQVWTNERFIYVPYYGLSYLLRKLQEYHPELGYNGVEWWAEDIVSETLAKSDTPEDAVCELAIRLSKKKMSSEEELEYQRGAEGAA